MYSRSLSLAVVLAGCIVIGCSKAEQPDAVDFKQYITPPKQKKIPASTTALRVCADPNNLPFSNKKGEGFENKLAELVASDMNVPVEYTWWAQRRGFFRSTLKAGMCDVVMGVPNGFEMAITTRPYYRSSYVFVSRGRPADEVSSFDDPRLKDMRIGVQLIGNDGVNTPPVQALNSRGIVSNIKGYTLYGNYLEPNPPARVIDAVAKRDVDIAVAWGPLAGYFAKREGVPLTLKPVSPQIDLPYLPFVFDISVGVRRGEDDLKNRIDDILDRRRAEVQKILDDYGVPRVGTSEQQISALRRPDDNP